MALMRTRTPTISPNTEMALMPCSVRVTKFMLELPEIRLPRGTGWVVYPSPDRKTAAA